MCPYISGTRGKLQGGKRQVGAMRGDWDRRGMERVEGEGESFRGPMYRRGSGISLLAEAFCQVWLVCWWLTAEWPDGQQSLGQACS